MFSSSLLSRGLSTPQELIAAITEANVVTVNYRLGYTNAEAMISSSGNSRTRPFYRYPTPVHDTLAGFDWVLETLRPEQLFVFGSNIGGSLATMLSLTESQHIHAVAAHEPVCDWTGLDDYCTIDSEMLTGSGGTIEKQSELIVPEGEKSQQSPAQPVQTKQPSKHRKKPAPFDLVPLLNTRKHLFETPSKYFDSFASPILFLRSAGKDVPKIMPEYFTGPEYPVPVLKTSVTEEELIDLWDIQMHIEDEPKVTEPKTTEDAMPVEERPSRRRKALSRWPPYGLDAGNDGRSRFAKPTRLQITLPWVRFYARLGSSEELSEAVVNSIDDSNPPKAKANSRKSATESTSVLATQAKDMVSVMRRACFWREEAGNGEERVTLRNVTVTATTDSRQLTDPNYLETIHESANWFREVMSNSR
ncbi:uncharacterized protein BHQ10_007011 [Talaromyces amestolkiae]|uniref:Alpha/beta hydrolase fold-3 domain-containing protein n=1 Tax=Talaromyces amestolkiae TaxID=1196081 RepID=A0A364L5B7_TALAM|nr:uncharacterized protein BHQ10_007011 [Talaromyces amestolkiae]RAO70999.1 hypothetical protein BHQ10_007011 [Talaromyces amestolkiae]